MISDALSTDASWCIMHEAPRGTPYNGLHGEVSPESERRTFFRLQVCEYGERVGKSDIWVWERAQKG